MTRLDPTIRAVLAAAPRWTWGTVAYGLFLTVAILVPWLFAYALAGWAGVAGLAAFVLFTGALVLVQLRQK